MSDKKGIDLGDYVEVKDRIRLFYELFGSGRLVTEDVTILTDPAGKQRVMVKALAYRTVDDPHPGVGHSWMEIPGRTPYTNGSEIENAETSAWGRAIGSLGILIAGSIATTNEIESKGGTTPPPRATATQPPVPAPSGPVTRPGIPVAVAVQREDPLAEARAIFDEPPLPEPDFTPQQIIPPAPHGGWSEGQVHTPDHKPLRARQNGSLFCPSKLPNGGWCSFKTGAA